MCLPISKSDYRGTGAKRRLRCNCASVGPERCAPHRLRKQRRDRIKELGGDPDNEDTWTEEILTAPLFPNGWGEVPSKAKVIEGWNKVAPVGHDALSGHSARRSGAKRRAREGWALSIIMLLGRWAGSSILAYVEEALAELPISGDGSRQRPTARLMLSGDEDDWDEAVPALQDRMAELEKRLLKVRSQLTKQEAKLTAMAQETTKQVAAAPATGRRWLRSTRPGGKIHREASRPSDASPTWQWQTGCTWKFGLSAFYEWLTEAEVREAPDATKCDKGCDVWM